MISLPELWWSWLLPAAVQATPVLLLAAALDLLLPRLLDPRLRAALWIAAAAKLLAPVRSGGLLPNPFTGPPPFWTSAIPMAWAAGSVALALGSAIWVWSRLRRIAVSDTSHPVPVQFSEAARMLDVRAKLRVSERCEGPFTWGRSVHWPASLTSSLTRDEILQVMRHELTHIRRRDQWRELLWSALLAVYWFHPLVWWAVRRMRAIREQCCDLTARGLPGHCADTYRDALLRVIRLVHLPTPGLALVDPRAPLTHRLLLLDGASRWTRWRGWGAMAAVAIAWPLAAWATERSHAVAEWIARPPGSLQLRYLVIERLAQENSK